MTRAITAAILISLEAVASDAILREYECPSAPPAVRQEDGSWVLPKEREERISCGLNACAAHRDALQSQLSDARGLQLKKNAIVLVVGLALGVLVGGGVVFVATRK